jgi:hypothetical protein
MTTLTAPTKTPLTSKQAKVSVSEQRVRLRGIGWDGYETILKLVGHQAAVRLTSDRGDLERLENSGE